MGAENSADETIRLRGSSPGKEPKLPSDRVFSLIVLEGKNSGVEYTIQKWTVIIGRDASVSDFVIDDPGASRSHACLEYHSGSFVIEDLESTNGVFVNDKPTSRHELTNGDKIAIG